MEQLNTVRVRKYNALPCLSGKKEGKHSAFIVLYIVFVGKKWEGGKCAPGYAPA